jgi:hypothetical protein
VVSDRTRMVASERPDRWTTNVNKLVTTTASSRVQVKLYARLAHSSETGRGQVRVSSETVSGCPVSTPPTRSSWSHAPSGERRVLAGSSRPPCSRARTTVRRSKRPVLVETGVVTDVSLVEVGEGINERNVALTAPDRKRMRTKGTPVCDRRRVTQDRYRCHSIRIRCQEHGKPRHHHPSDEEERFTEWVLYRPSRAVVGFQSRTFRCLRWNFP